MREQVFPGKKATPTGRFLHSWWLIVGTLIAAELMSVAAGHGQPTSVKPEMLQNVGVEEHLGGFIPLFAEFIDDHGQTVKLENYFRNNRPVILILAYYTCPMLCTMLLNGVADAIKRVGLEPDDDYRIVTISINPAETWGLAAAKKQNYVESVGKPGLANGWAFLVGTRESIESLANSVGFNYFYDEARKEYAHPAVITILSGKGEICRYLYGLEFKPTDLRLALIEAARGEIGRTIDKFMLYCYHYDPQARGYVLFAANLMRIGGAMTVILLGVGLGIVWLREFRRRSQKRETQT